MNRIGIRFSLAALLLAAAAVSGAAAQDQSVLYEKTFPIDPGRPAELEFRDVDGSLSLTTAPGDAFEVRIRKEIRGARGRTAERLLRDTKIEVSSRGNSLNIRVRYPRFRGLFFWLTDNGRIRVTSEIAVPRKAGVRARLVDGAITASGLSGEINLETVDGDIRVEGTEGDIRARSVDGTLAFENIRGGLIAGTTDGRIRAAGELSRLRLSSTDGDIRIGLSAGSIPAEAWEIRTTDGSVEMTLPAGFAADLDAKTGDGRISADVTLAEIRENSKRRLAGRLGAGGPRLTIRTGDGSIRIRGD